MCFSMFFLFAACEPNNNVSPSEEPISIDLSNMDLSDLSFEMDMTSSFTFGLSDRESLDQLRDQLIEELFQDEKFCIPLATKQESKKYPQEQLVKTLLLE